MTEILPFHAWREFYVENDDDTVLTLVPASDGPRAIVTIAYTVSESGGGTSAGTTTCIPGTTVNLYNVGGNTFTLAVSAGGEITVSRTVGTTTFDARIHLVWV